MNDDEMRKICSVYKNGCPKNISNTTNEDRNEFDSNGGGFGELIKTLVLIFGESLIEWVLHNVGYRILYPTIIGLIGIANYLRIKMIGRRVPPPRLDLQQQQQQQAIMPARVELIQPNGRQRYPRKCKSKYKR